MDWTIFIQLVIGVVIVFVIGLLLVRYLNGFYDVKKEEVIKEIRLFWSEAHSLPYATKLLIKRTYKNGRVKYFKKQL